jgi:hypothetical protein
LLDARTLKARLKGNLPKFGGMRKPFYTLFLMGIDIGTHRFIRVIQHSMINGLIIPEKSII